MSQWDRTTSDRTESLARRAAQRSMLRGAARTGGHLLLAGAALGLGAVATDKLIGPGLDWRLLAGVPMLAALAGSAAWALARWPRPLDAAIELDTALGLNDSLGSALLLQGARGQGARRTPAGEESNEAPDPFIRLALQAAETQAARVRPGDAIRVRFGPSWAWWPALCAMAAAVGVFVEPLRLLDDKRTTLADATNPALTQQTLEQLKKATDIVQPPTGAVSDSPSAPQAAENNPIEALARQLERGETTPAEALAAAASVLEKQAQEAQQRAQQSQSEDQALREALAQAAGSDPASVPSTQSPDERASDASQAARALRESLASGDLSSAARAVEEIRKQLDAMPEAERRALAEELDDLSKDLATSAQQQQQQAQAEQEQTARALEDQGLPSQTAEQLADEPNVDAIEQSLREQGIDEETARERARQLAQANEERRAREEAAQRAQELSQAAAEAADEVREAPEPVPSEPAPSEPVSPEPAAAPETPPVQPPESQPPQQPESGAPDSTPQQEGSDSQSAPSPQPTPAPQPAPSSDGQQPGSKSPAAEPSPSGESSSRPQPSGQSQSQGGQESQPTPDPSGQQPGPSEDAGAEDTGAQKEGSAPQPASGEGPEQPAGAPQPQGAPPSGPAQPSTPQQGQTQQSPAGQKQPGDAPVATPEPGQRPEQGGQPQPQPSSQSDKPPTPMSGGDQQSPGGGKSPSQQPGTPSETPSATPTPGGQPGPEQPQPGDGDAPSQGNPSGGQPPSGLESLERQLESADQAPAGAQQERERAEQLRKEAQRLLDQASPEERQRLDAWARERAKEGNPAAPDANMTGKGGNGSGEGQARERVAPGTGGPEPFRTEEVDARSGGDAPARVAAEWTDPNQQIVRDGTVSRREMTQTLREGQRSAEEAIEEQAVPARYRNVREYFKKAVKRAENDPAASPSAPPAEPAPAAKDAGTPAKP